MFVTRQVVATVGLSMALFAGYAPPTVASSGIQDGTFTGSGWTQWGGITEHPAPNGIPGNYAALSNGADLFQYFVGPSPGLYTLQFYVRNESAWTADLEVALQNPGGGIPPSFLELAQVVEAPQSSPFILVDIPVQLSEPPGTATEITFTNSFDNPHSSGAGFFWPGEGSINPFGTVLDVADVSLTPGASGTPAPIPNPNSLDLSMPATPAPELSTWAMMALGFTAVAVATRRRPRGSRRSAI